MTLRRVATAVAAGVLALGGLVACDSHPAVAAYVGDTEFTVAEVDAIYDDLVERQPDTIVTREQIVVTLVMGELVRSLAEQSGAQLRPVTAEDVGRGENVPADSRYAEIRADMATYLLSWSGQVEADEVSEEHLRELHELAIEAGEEWANQPLDDLRPILGGERVAQAIAIREALEAEAERVGVSVNPRYGEAMFVITPFSSGAPAVFVAFGEAGTDAVENTD